MTWTMLAHSHAHTALWIKNYVGNLKNLYSEIKFILLLPTTQVYREWYFSKLNRFKECSRKELLSFLLFMYVEFDLLKNINVDEITDQFGQSIKELKKFLSLLVLYFLIGNTVFFIDFNFSDIKLSFFSWFFLDPFFNFYMKFDRIHCKYFLPFYCK